MITSRQLTSHTYNEETAASAAEKIVALYFQLFKELQIKLEEYKNEEQKEL